MYINRGLENRIIEYMDSKEIIAVIGTRQCGKTTLVNHILEDYDNVNSITFEDVDTRLLFEEDIKSFVELHIKGYDYLFIDEVQYAQNSGKQLKYIYDTRDIKMLISGSSSTDLSIHSLKYLVGRILVFELYPLSFKEYLSYENEKLYRLYNKGNFKNIISNRILNYVKEYLKFGGYPRVVTAG